jgi:hypothetical protein
VPLDFLALSDHAEFLGEIRNIHRIRRTKTVISLSHES